MTSNCQDTLGLVQEAADFLPQPRRGRGFGQVAGGDFFGQHGFDAGAPFVLQNAEHGGVAAHTAGEHHIAAQHALLRGTYTFECADAGVVVDIGGEGHAAHIPMLESVLQQQIFGALVDIAAAGVGVQPGVADVHAFVVLVDVVKAGAAHDAALIFHHKRQVAAGGALHQRGLDIAVHIFRAQRAVGRVLPSVGAFGGYLQQRIEMIDAQRQQAQIGILQNEHFLILRAGGQDSATDETLGSVHNSSVRKILSAKARLQGEKRSKVGHLASIFNAAGAFLSHQKIATR